VREVHAQIDGVETGVSAISVAPSPIEPDTLQDAVGTMDSRPGSRVRGRSARSKWIAPLAVLVLASFGVALYVARSHSNLTPARPTLTSTPLPASTPIAATTEPSTPSPPTPVITPPSPEPATHPALGPTSRARPAAHPTRRQRTPRHHRPYEPQGV
jgi:hypothetical protein